MLTELNIKGSFFMDDEFCSGHKYKRIIPRKKEWMEFRQKGCQGCNGYDGYGCWSSVIR